MTLTLKDLKNRVDLLIHKEGEGAPVAAWIITRPDVCEAGDNFKPEVELEAATAVVENLEDYDHIYEEIFNCIDKELCRLGVWSDGLN